MFLKKFINNYRKQNQLQTMVDIRTFFPKVMLPTLSSDQLEMLDAPIEESEVRAAIMSMKTAKSPGLDGFPVEYYRKYTDIVAPILKEVYREALALEQLPPTFNDALITLILKKDKDPYDPGSFRPVSLENVDCKILSKVLALRLEGVLSHIVHSDQVGFIRGRSSSDNLRSLLHLIWQNRNENVPVAAFSLDAMKAFDRVEWGYLIYTLQVFGFGPVFLKWVKVLYSAPRAAVLSNGIISPFFKLGRGTRQGDPLSPLLFTLFLEPLAIAIRRDIRVKGVQMGDREYKLFLYADNILLLLSNPNTSIPGVMDIIENFSQISGYKVNWQVRSNANFGRMFAG